MKILQDTSIDWIGDIPSNWRLQRLKSVIESSQNGIWGSEPQNDDNDLICVRVADFDMINLCIDQSNLTTRNVQQQDQSSRLLHKDDLLIEKSGGGEKQLVGRVIRFNLDEKAVCSNFVARIQPNKSKVHSLFLLYFFQHLYHCRVNYRSIKQTTGIQNLDTKSYFNECISLPPLVEQVRIANFIDRKTAQIDDLITRKQRLIELLQEQRTALINRAVMKGLNPDAPMKDSGIEWLGEVPAHWVRLPLKYVVNDIIDAEHKTAPYYEDGQYLVVRTSNVRNGQLTLEDGKYTNFEGYTEWTRRAIPQPGDILFTREAPAGEACIVPKDVTLCLGQRMVLLRVNHTKLNENFGLWSLYSRVAWEFINSTSQGSTVDHINMSDIRNIPVLLPPLYEQQQIVDYLSDKTNQIESIIDKENNLIRLLSEYRTSLISEAVTGKIDVRDEVPA